MKRVFGMTREELSPPVMHWWFGPCLMPPSALAKVSMSTCPMLGNTGLLHSSYGPSSTWILAFLLGVQRFECLFYSHFQSVDFVLVHPGNGYLYPGMFLWTQENQRHLRWQHGNLVSVIANRWQMPSWSFIVHSHAITSKRPLKM